MKKLAFLFVATAAMTMISCGGNTQQNEATEDSLSAEELVAPCCTDSCTGDSCDSCPNNDAECAAECASEEQTPDAI